MATTGEDERAVSASGTADDAEAPETTAQDRVLLAWTGPALVAVPNGVLDTECIDELDSVLEGWPRVPVVIDLDECTLVERSALDGLDPARWDRIPEQICVTSSRVTALVLLARARVSGRLAVFQRPADAVQALILAEYGYGTGWRMDRA